VGEYLLNHNWVFNAGNHFNRAIDIDPSQKNHMEVNIVVFSFSFTIAICVVGFDADTKVKIHSISVANSSPRKSL